MHFIPEHWLYIIGERMDQQVITIRGSLARRVRREAERLGISVDEYLVEALSQGLDPSERAREYIEAARDLLEEAREELRRGDVRQAAEKLWGATALAIKAYAYYRDGKRLASHRELWEYKRRLEKELGEWVSDSWNAGNTMHICFYENWCAEEDIEIAYKRIEKLVKELAARLRISKY